MLGIFFPDIPATFGDGIILDPGTRIGANIATGSGGGNLVVRDGEIDIEGHADKGGKYTENWNIEAAVLDFRLPQPIAIRAGQNRIAFRYKRHPDQNRDNKVSLRLLIEDKRGGIWAVGTQMGSGMSRDFIAMQTYAFDISEAGRIDAWIMTSLQPDQFDEYNAPQEPFRLVGFRVVVEEPAGNTFSIALRELEGLSPTDVPDPYWSLLPQRLWSLRNGFESPPYGGEQDWGAAHATPFLKASSLQLSSGNYRAVWEILGLDGWKVQASDVREISVANMDTKVAEFPPLANGSYQVRLGLQKKGTSNWQEYFFNYVVIRNSKGGPPILYQRKPLLVESAHAPSFRDNEARVTIKCDPKIGLDARIVWTVESADLRLLKSGEASASKPLEIDLSEWAGIESSLWIKAVLKTGREDLDICRRVVGFSTHAESVVKTPVKSQIDKLDSAIKGKLYRMKGDWAEGATPMVTQSAKILEQLGPWLDEAQKTGYNLVELSAPWDDLNPLPGVFQFNYLDKLVVEARKRGLFVTLRIHPTTSLTPDWVRREFMENENGFAHGVWRGRRDLVFSPAAEEYRKALFGFVEALAGHYRATPTVVGYCLESLFFDHDLLDAPWMGSYVDYSDASRRAFLKSLRSRYKGSLDELNGAYQTSYKSWDDVPMPRIKLIFDKDGRIKPRTEPPWRDWTDYKVGEFCSLRSETVRAIRRGDPNCWVGLYLSESSRFQTREFANTGCWITYGGMESQYPQSLPAIRGRYEPHQKMARTKTIVDVGLSNLLMSGLPGHSGFFNYWYLDKRFATISPAEREAEERLSQWFSIVDRLVGAEPVEETSQKRSQGAYLVAPASQISLLQHAFTGRTEDYLKPWLFRAGEDKIQIDEIVCEKGEAADFSSYAYVYVPFSTAAIEAANTRALADYVQKGGRLAIEATSGFWLDAVPNSLGAAFGLPAAKPIVQTRATANENAPWLTDSPIQQAPLVFRTSEFHPPINDQPTPWIHTIPRAFLRPYRMDGVLPDNAKVIARFSDDSPAAALLPFGQGEVLVFFGVVDWLECPGLARMVDAWGRRKEVSPISVENPELLVKSFRKDRSAFIVGRRFIGHDSLERLKSGKAVSDLGVSKDLIVKFPRGALSPGNYCVRELVERKDLGIISEKKLRDKGISLNLAPGQGFLLEAVPSENH